MPITFNTFMPEKTKKRAARRDADIDAIRTIWWFRCLSNHLETDAPREVQRAIAPNTLSSDVNADPIKNNKFLGYSRGAHVPSEALALRAERVAPRSSWVLYHPIWTVLRSAGPIHKHAMTWVRQLDHEIQGIVLGPYSTIVGGASRHTLGALERRASLDSLAALTLLARLHHEAGEHEWVWLYTCSIFRVLLLLGTHFDQYGVAERMFQLYVQRVFSLAEFEGQRVDLSNYDYVFASYHLVGIAERVRNKHGSQRDRRMPTFYALQALTGLYEQRFKKHFQIPLVSVADS